MAQPQSPQAALPPIPAEPVREGSRWRHHRPGAEDVAAWFSSQPLDAGMEHDHYIGGVVLIPQVEKVKHRQADGRQVERFEDTWTPYMQVGTRIAYLRRLAEHRELIHRIEPVQVPIISDRQSAFYNANMEEGYWWHCVVGEQRQTVRYLCCTMRVALYEPTTYGRLIRGEQAPPVLEGRSTKQVAGGADLNQLAKAQTSAIGRALGVAGILTLGTGVASAEDMLELAGAPGAGASPEQAQLPADEPVTAPAADPGAELDALRARAVELQSTMQVEAPHGWRAFAAWWQERSKQEGWGALSDVPLESLKGVVARMEREHQAALTFPAQANEQTEVEA